MSIQFIVEDGTGMATATSYVTLVEFQQYWENMGYDYSALTTNQIQVLLNKCSKVIDSKYKWPGERASSEQGLDWPRVAAWYQDGWPISSLIVPPEVKYAVCEMAYAKNAGTDMQPVVTPTGDLKSESVSVGPISESKTYGSSASDRSRVTAVADALVRIIGKGSQLNLLRV